MKKKVTKKIIKTPTKKVAVDTSKKIPNNYYSIYFSENDINNLSDIEITTHENCIALDVKHINKMANYFVTKKEASQAKRAIWDALKTKAI